ncbi:sensor domain-containing diguanylate cyclase [Craterilacuibacter sp.]|uniref:sensor domain-containing diguanylate cyclase n=1 Tax=Craterilacuibacter sp. TaxID=2870909 RepID=UPI003F395484
MTDYTPRQAQQQLLLLLAYGLSMGLGHFLLPPLAAGLLPASLLALAASLRLGWPAIPSWLLCGTLLLFFLPQQNATIVFAQFLFYFSLLLLAALWTQRQQRAHAAISKQIQTADSQALYYQTIAASSPFPLLLNRIEDGTILYSNQQANRLFRNPLDPESLLRVQDFYVDPDKRARANITLMNVGAQSEQEAELIDGQGRHFWALISSNWLRINNELLVLSAIYDISERKQLEIRLQAGNASLQQHVQEIERLQHGLREQALTDVLTGVFNRRHLESIMPSTLKVLQRQASPLGVLMLDADHFKKINDNYGHKSGDLVLAAIGKTLRDFFRDSDIVCRYGGEEFVVMLPGTSLEQTEIKAGQLRRKIEQLRVTAVDGQILQFTVSIGVSAYPLHGDDAETLIHAADDALYRAKADGRNRVYCAHLSTEAKY